jgi:hypothetical protein
VVLVNEEPCCGMSRKTRRINNGCVCLYELTLHRRRSCSVNVLNSQGQDIHSNE